MSRAGVGPKFRPVLSLLCYYKYNPLNLCFYYLYWISRRNIVHTGIRFVAVRWVKSKGIARTCFEREISHTVLYVDRLWSIAEKIPCSHAYETIHFRGTYNKHWFFYFPNFTGRYKEKFWGFLYYNKYFFGKYYQAL